MIQKNKTVAVAAGVIAVLVGTYGVRAVEQNKAETAQVAVDVQPVAASTEAPPRIASVSTSYTKAPKQIASTASTASTSSAAPVVAVAADIIPSGTTVKAKIQTVISSRNAKVGDQVTAVTTEDVVVNGKVLIPAGSSVLGQVTEVKPAAETRSDAVLKIAFSKIGLYSTGLAMTSPDLAARAKNASRAVDAGIVVGTTATGAVIGNQTDHKYGTEIGAVVGGIVGGAVATNVGANVQLKAGEIATIRFTQDAQM